MASIFDGDLWIVNQAVWASHAGIVLAIHPDYPPIPLGPEADRVIDGVVIHSIRSYQPVRSRLGLMR